MQIKLYKIEYADENYNNVEYANKSIENWINMQIKL